MLCNGSITACGKDVLFRAELQNAVGVSSILTFRFEDVKSNERSEFDSFNSLELNGTTVSSTQCGLTFRFFAFRSESPSMLRRIKQENAKISKIKSENINLNKKGIK